jgi:lipoyl(octanoyl) transferase
MAVDEALARELAPGEGVLRIYRWARPSLSLGRNQRALGRYDPEAFDPLGVELVRRPTGGREVLHDRELTYALVVPLAGPGTFRATYRTVNEALVAALRSLGVEARLAQPTARTPPPDRGACFAEAAADEIEADGRKLVGSAQVRIGGSLLQHGSVLLGPPSVDLGSLAAPRSGGGGEAATGTGDLPAADGDDAGSQPGAHLAALLGRAVSFPGVAAAVEAALAGALGGKWVRDGLREGERRAAASAEPRYRSPAWNWKR